jgi:hypothetical protein
MSLNPSTAIKTGKKKKKAGKRSDSQEPQKI